MLQFGDIYKFTCSNDYWKVREVVVKNKEDLPIHTSPTRYKVFGKNPTADIFIKQTIKKLDIKDTDYEQVPNTFYKKKRASIFLVNNKN